jgi:hypothetical protein
MEADMLPCEGTSTKAGREKGEGNTAPIAGYMCKEKDFKE